MNATALPDRLFRHLMAAGCVNPRQELARMTQAARARQDDGALMVATLMRQSAGQMDGQRGARLNLMI